MGFNSGQAVERLDWDFTAHIPDAKGVVPEPSEAQVREFWRKQRQIVGYDDTDGDSELSDEQVLERLGKMTEEENQKVADEMLATYAELCSHQPTVEQLKELPYRPRQAFFGWITGQVVNPT